MSIHLWHMLHLLCRHQLLRYGFLVPVTPLYGLVRRPIRPAGVSDGSDSGSALHDPAQSGYQDVNRVGGHEDGEGHGETAEHMRERRTSIFKQSL